MGQVRTVGCGLPVLARFSMCSGRFRPVIESSKIHPRPDHRVRRRSDCHSTAGRREHHKHLERFGDAVQGWYAEAEEHLAGLVIALRLLRCMAALGTVAGVDLCSLPGGLAFEFPALPCGRGRGRKRIGTGRFWPRRRGRRPW